MADTMSYLSTTHNGLLSDNPSVLRSQLSRIAGQAASKSRKQRNSLFRYNKLIKSLPEDARQFHQDNPQALGLPRTYSIRVVKDEFSDQAAAQAIDGKTITFGKHGYDDSGLNIDGQNIAPSDVTWSAATKNYTFSTNVDREIPSLLAPDVAGHFTFEAAVPAGSLAIGQSMVNVELDKTTTWYDVDVAAEAGALWDTSKNQLSWDESSSKWTQAHWEVGRLTFGYDVENLGDDLQPNWVGENRFIDSYSSPPTVFELIKDNYGTSYTCIIGASTDKGAPLDTKVTVPPPQAPAERKDSVIRSVFPVEWSIQFTPFADSFVGAFKDAQNNVFAVKGRVRTDEDQSMPESAAAAAAAPEEIPAMEEMEVEKLAEGVSAMEETKPQMPPVTFHSIEKTALKSAPPSLKVVELLSFNPMTPDKEDPSGYSDSIASQAMKDFQNIIIYHMDEDLRTAFISASQIHLDSEVLEIANDDKDNSSFYKSLQVPLITSLLASGTSEPGKHCNSARANARLKSTPADSEVYKRHSAKLYRYRYMRRFNIKKFLDDQQRNPRTDRLDAFCERMKRTLQDKSKGLDVGNDNYANQLKDAKAEIDRLAQWAKDKNLYWAMELFYWIENASRRNWYAQYTSGKASSSIGMFLKQLNGLFGLLENNAINTQANGRCFMQAFNQEVRLFQMTSIIPQLVDINGNSLEIDSMMKECLYSYAQQYKNVSLEDHRAAVEAAMKLYNDKELRAKFFGPLAVLTRVSSAAGTWNSMMVQYEGLVVHNAWFERLAGASKYLEVFSLALCTVLLILPLIPSVRENMTEKQKVQWGLSLGAVLGMALLKLAQNTVRVYYFWNDLATKWDILKVLAGSEEVIEAIPQNATKIQNGFARWFARTKGQTALLAEIEEGAVSNFTRVEEIFGRNLGEFLGAVVGFILGIVTIVLIAMEMDMKKDGLLQAMDIIMLISASLQVLAVVAGWVVAAWGAVGIAAGGAYATAISAMTICATWSGPFAVFFAVVGLIIFLVWYLTTDHREPITKFVEDKTKPAGLWVDSPMQAPEYLQFVPASDTSPSLSGLSIRGPLLPAEKLPEYPTQIDAKYLKLDAGSQNVQLVDALDYTMDIVWSLETDPMGKSLIYTKQVTKDSKSGNETSKRWYLASADDHKLYVREMPPSGSADEYKKALPSIQWQVDLQEPPKINDKKSVLSAKATIRKNSNHLVRTVQLPDPKPTPGLRLFNLDDWRKGVNQWKLVNHLIPIHLPNFKEPPKPMPFFLWELTMEPLGPSSFNYSHDQWVLNEKSTNERIYPRFDNISSDGLKWSIEPALDASYFELVTGSSTDAGVVKQKENVTPAIMPQKAYMVTCTLAVNGQAKGSSSAKITIEVA